MIGHPSTLSDRSYLDKLPADAPARLLLPYQHDWSFDASRFKIGLMARQVGKDFASGEEGIRDCMAAEKEGRKTTWMIAAPSERQSLESLEKWKDWAKIYSLAIDDYREERTSSAALLSSATITFPGGSRVIAVPGRPDTVRGFSANVLLTEFAFFEDPDGTWRAIYPSISNPLRGLKIIRLISTPNGIGNKFHALWKANYQSPDAKWSCHRISIHDAAANGLPVNIEELREGISDPDGWSQEYELEFMDTSSVLLPYDLIALCESPFAAEAHGPEFWVGSSRNRPPLYMGIDFGRKRDLTVAWTGSDLSGGKFRTDEVLCLEKMSTPDQVERLSPRIERVRRVCLDYTGPGVGLGDYLVKRFGEFKPEANLFGKIELCTFTNDLKVDIFSKLRMAFDNKSVFIPGTRDIREDLHSICRVITPSGNITYRAPHLDGGHADRCTALALAWRAFTLIRAGAINNDTAHHLRAKSSRYLRPILN